MAVAKKAAVQVSTMYDYMHTVDSAPYLARGII
jgi:hypothetical protein